MLERILLGGSNPFMYRLQDLWLELYQAPWAIPQDKEQLLNDLSAKVASGELFIYLETDQLAPGPGRYKRSGPGAPPEPPEDAPRTSGTNSKDSASMTAAPAAGLPAADSDGVNAGSGVGGKGVVPDKLTTATRVAKLDLEGHAPIRHGGTNRVTDLQLEDRAVRGIDPASGTTFDAFNKFPDGSPKLHKVGRNATAFISDDALLQADDFARSSAQFQQNVATARTNGDIFVDPVELPLRDVFGSSYQNYVRGVTRLGSKNNPTGHIPTDFTDGTLKAIYRLDQKGSVKLHTLYPNPKP